MIKSQYNFNKWKVNKGFKTTTPSQTIPEQGYTIKQLYEMYANNITPPVHTYENLFDGLDLEEIDLQMRPGMDIIEFYNQLSDHNKHLVLKELNDKRAERLSKKSEDISDDLKNPKEMSDITR